MARVSLGASGLEVLVELRWAMLEQVPEQGLGFVKSNVHSGRRLTITIPVHKPTPSEGTPTQLRQTPTELKGEKTMPRTLPEWRSSRSLQRTGRE